ncbi:MAG: YqaJ-like viral recombinase domain protein [Alphaproteobacteria bacterium ADurb.Bin438]|nr:MAG: YqaJ-like viral recombinase domain protein [Alphaproteobacteria bacterium ADurb.Bin438]
MLRNEWLEKRKQGIGGSDAAAIMGLNPYMSNVDLWEYKTNRKVQEDISEKPFVKYGTKAEKPLIELFKLDYPEYKVTHKDFDMVTHPKHDFLIGSLDGRLIHKETGKKGILEIKTTNIMNGGQLEKWNDRIPDNYFCQVLHYLLVTGFDFAILRAQLKFFGEPLKLETRHYFFEREEYIDDIGLLMSNEIEFWNDHVLTDKKPNLILPPI